MFFFLYKKMILQDQTISGIIGDFQFLTVSLYKEFFCPISTTHDDQIEDSKLQKRIQQLHWITCQHLDILLNEREKKVRDLINMAIDSINEMDSVQAPQDKLLCLTRCCQKVVKALEKSKKSPGSADDFLPTLIYILLKANPPKLQSNINYINRFSNATRLISGESAYLFVSLCCAVSFIQNMNAESLNMTTKEFDDRMSGKVVPTLVSWESHFTESLQALEVMTQVVTEIENRNLEFLKSTEQLQHKIEEETKSHSIS